MMQETSNLRPLGEPSYRSPDLTTKTWAATFDLTKLITNTCVRAIKLLSRDIIVFLLTIYTAYAYAMIFSYFASFNYVLSLEYGFSLQQIGLSFLSIVIGYCLAGLMFAILDATLYARARKAASLQDRALQHPEHRLYAALIGSIFVPPGLFWFVALPLTLMRICLSKHEGSKDFLTPDSF